MHRYAHTNIIARDCEKLIAFYKEVFACRSIGEKRDLRGAWLDHLTGIPEAHIIGEHLILPGYGEDHPTLEISLMMIWKEICLAESTLTASRI